MELTQILNHHLLRHAIVFMKAQVGQTVRSVSVDTQGGKMQYPTPGNTLFGGGFKHGFYSHDRLSSLGAILFPWSYPQTNHSLSVQIRERNGKSHKHGPLVKSQLNGINGEVTGTDDLATAGAGSFGKKSSESLDLLERSRREARNKTFSRSSSGDSKRGSKEINYTKRQERKQQGGTCVGSQPTLMITDTPNTVETFTCYVIPSSIPMYEIQGMAYAHIPSGYVTFTGKESFVPVGTGNLIGVKLLVQSCGVGWFIRSSIEAKNKINYITSTACVVLVNDGFTYRDTNNRLVHCEGKEFIVYKPLFANFLRNVRSDALTDFVVKQCMMIASNASFLVDGLPDHAIMLSTLEAYKYWLFRRGINQNSSQTRRFITLNYDALGYHETQHALHEEAWIMANHIVVEGKFSPWTEESITTDTLDLNSWEPREDFTVINLHGVDISTGRFDFGYDSVYPKRFKVTKFFSFEGLGLTPFNKHTRNNLNLSHGCKRLIGCRGTVQEESLLRHNAAMLACALYDPTSEFENRIIRKCLGRSRLGYLALENTPSGVVSFIKDGFDELVNLVRPHFFAKKLDAAKTWLHTAKYAALEQWYQHSPFHGRSLWAKIPHAKAKQRTEFVAGRMFHHEEYSPLTKMTVCIKDELGKFGKPCRLFVTLDTESAYAPTLPMHIKILMHGTHMHQLPIPGTSRIAILEIFVYAQPDPTLDEMDYVAQKMSEARFLEDYLFVCLHSDDSAMVGNINGRKIMCNNDISSNDSGQDAPVFFGMAKLQGLLSEKLAEGLLDLACLPIEIKSSTSDSKCTIQFDKPMEPSGHSNTTSWNNLGSTMCSLSIFHYLVTTDASLQDCVSSGAAVVGHVMTCDVCEYIEDLQFLKFSPVSCGGKYVMMANLGRIFRRLGVVDNDMTHVQLGVDLLDFRAMTPEERMNRFWSGVILGLKNEPSNVILDALRTRFDSSRFAVTESALELLTNERVDSYYSHSRTAKLGDCTESVMRRYRLTESETAELVDLIHDLTVGQRFKLTSIAKFFEKDYGVGHIVESLPLVAIGTLPGGEELPGRGRLLQDGGIEEKADD